MERPPPDAEPTADPDLSGERALLERAAGEMAARPPEEAPEAAEALAAAMAARLEGEAPPESALRALREMLGEEPDDPSPGE